MTFAAMLPTDTRRARHGTGYNSSSMLPQYLRRLCRFAQMDLEYTATQMVYLCFSPSRVCVVLELPVPPPATANAMLTPLLLCLLQV